MNSRTRDIGEIADALRSKIRLRNDRAIVAAGDSLALIRTLPAQCISLVLTDPPYHATKKHNIYGDTSFEEDKQYLTWMNEYAQQWHRILKPNGSVFCFCDSSMAARLELAFSSTFNVLSHIVWTKPNDPGFDGWKGKMRKEALRQWYPHSERILFAEPAIEGNLHRSPFGHYLREMRKQAGLSAHQLTAAIGAYGRVNHGGAVSNWEAGRNTPSRDQYQKICDVLVATGAVRSMLPYEDAIRVFNIDKSREFTDVWNFPSVRPYKGKHPAEKPRELLRHAIEATTNPGDIVLDCFAGSGSTALAAIETGRRSVSLEIEEKWAEIIASRVKDYLSANHIDQASPQTTPRKSRTPKQNLQPSLFHESR